MLRLSRIRERITWQVVVAFALYVAAAVVLAARFLPLRLKAGRLEGELNQLAKTEQQLGRLLDQASGLEARLAELQARLDDYAGSIPSQYDLQKALTGIERLAAYYDLSVQTLSAAPLQVYQDGKAGQVALWLEVAGGSLLPSYLDHLQELVPSLHVQELNLSYLGEGRFALSLAGNMHVVLVPSAEQSSYELPSFGARKTRELGAQAFGLPFDSIWKFLQGGVRVLGIVTAGNEKAVLVQEKGEAGRWLRVGDRLNQAVVIDISHNGLWLDLDGVELRLTIGG